MAMGCRTRPRSLRAQYRAAADYAERRTPNAERRTPNAERRTPNAERRTPTIRTPADREPARAARPT
ncbi:LysR family transcriptional regulator [Burkholderia multivorans]|uniref:LysR family transcriptional regulator n=1 Tax=Burkholderia multivorans TaxID=87883 RepID=A0A8E2RSA2_9BURK|nr:LysR family transcriptional regulator [Burkholderia multivorans]